MMKARATRLFVAVLTYVFTGKEEYFCKLSKKNMFFLTERQIFSSFVIH